MIRVDSGTVHNIGQTEDGGIPNITAEISYDGTNQTNGVGLVARNNGAGAFYGKTNVSKTLNIGSANSSTRATLGFDASRSSSLYKNDWNWVMPRNIQMYWYIKY